MNLYLHLPTNLKIFELFVENKEYIVGWASKSEKKVAEFFLKNFPGEVMNEQSPQYETNFLAIRQLKKIDDNIFNRIQGIYYGSDNCEYLAPTVQEIEKAYDLFQEARKKYYFQWGFVFVTPYVWQKIMDRLQETLTWLDSKAGKRKIEVIVNDLWVLHFITKKTTNLQPIMWRVLHKLMKTPLVDTYWNKAHVPWDIMRNKSPQEIKEFQDQIVKNQNDFYQSCEATFEPYLSFLQKKWINRATLDFMENREKLYTQGYKIGIDLYYPWAIVFTWRLCDTSAIETPARWDYAIDTICSRTCARYDLFYKIKTVWYNLVQRWNAAYRSELNLEKLPINFLYNTKNRLVFAPFIAV